MMNDDIASELYSELYSVRLIVLIEDTPLSNKYRRVFCSKETLKQISEILGQDTNEKAGPYNIKMLKMSQETFDLPDFIE